MANRHLADWAKILTKLHNYGIDDENLAQEVGYARRTLGHIRDGRIKEPSYSKGMRIMDIYRSVFKST